MEEKDYIKLYERDINLFVKPTTQILLSLGIERSLYDVIIGAFYLDMFDEYRRPRIERYEIDLPHVYTSILHRLKKEPDSDIHYYEEYNPTYMEKFKVDRRENVPKKFHHFLKKESDDNTYFIEYTKFYFHKGEDDEYVYTAAGDIDEFSFFLKYMGVVPQTYEEYKNKIVSRIAMPWEWARRRGDVERLIEESNLRSRREFARLNDKITFLAERLDEIYDKVRGPD